MGRPGRLDQLIYIPLPDLPARQGILEATFKKSPVAPNVPMSFIAQKTEGFSGADLAELGQRAAKAAIRDCIAAEELDKDAMDVGHEIGRKHFEEAFAGARRSVANNDLAKFDQFRRKFDPLYKVRVKGWQCNGQTSLRLAEALQLQSTMMTICMHRLIQHHLYTDTIQRLRYSTSPSAAIALLHFT